MKDIPLVSCPKCSHDSLYRVIGAGGGMIFKGSGFYLTDYKSNKASASTGSPAKKSDASTSKPAGDEKKPASTSADTPAKPSTGSQK